MERKPSIASRRRFLTRDALAVALDLPGMRLRHGAVELEITEVEAYRHPDDSANHCRAGRTARNAAMWGAAGHAYVFLCYGIHHLLNVVCQGPGEGAAVLVRAARPVAGLEIVRRRRGQRPDRELTTGPGRVAAALGIDLAFDGHDLLAPGGLELRPAPGPPRALVAGPRIGIDYASPQDRAAPYRIALADSPFVTRPRELDERGLAAARAHLLGTLRESPEGGPRSKSRPRP